MAATLPLSSLHLLVPPLRLLTAAMWQVARHRNLKHYGMLEDFVSMVTEAVPQLLTDRQRSLLLLALRAKMILSDPPDVHAHLEKIRSIGAATLDNEVNRCCSSLLTLVNAQTQSPDVFRRLLQEAFDPTFDSALQSLVSDFLSQIEELFPIPDFRQVASCLDDAPSGVEDFLQVGNTEELRVLLTNENCTLGRVTPPGSGDSEVALLSVWPRPLLTQVTDPEADSQSDGVPEPLRVEVVLMMEVDHKDIEETVICTAASLEASSQSEAFPQVSNQSNAFPKTSNQSEAFPEVSNQSDVFPEASSQSEALQEMTNQCEAFPEVSNQSDAFPETSSQSETFPETSSQSEAFPETSSQSEAFPEVPNQSDVFPDASNQSAVVYADQSDCSCSNITAGSLYGLTHNPQRVAHKCPQCGKCFIYRSQVIRHLRTNRSCALALSKPHPQPTDSSPVEPRPLCPFFCFQCGSSFRTDQELQSHRRTHQPRPVYSCPHCHRSFLHMSSLTNHRQEHGDRCQRAEESGEAAATATPFRCRQRPPRLRPTDLRCSVCDETFKTQTLLLRHLQTHAVEGATPCFSCRYCSQSFSGVTQLRIHQRSHVSRSFRCTQCSKSYCSLTSLQAHQATHSTDRHFLCPQCGKRFRTSDSLEGHLKRHTGERPYRCPYCPKDFTALAGLNVHVRRHTGERLYVCSVCGKAWPSGGDLQKHMRTHTGERPYVCHECGKGFSISCHLTEHRRIHTGEKPFSCPECGKCLRRKFDLKKHMLSHSAVRTHACTVCGKSYTRKTHLSRHLLTHGDTPNAAL